MREKARLTLVNIPRNLILTSAVPDTSVVPDTLTGPDTLAVPNIFVVLESNGVPGRVQISSETESLLSKAFALEPREIEAKGKGTLSTFLIEPDH